MERKRSEWESGQSVLHKDEKGISTIENVYGSLNYTKGGGRHSQEKKGFVLEAKEAPGTAGHTEKEKQFQPELRKKVKMKDERFLYTSEIPFRDQAIFYDVTEREKSDEFIACLKNMIEIFDHRTVREVFGFLDQRPERLWKEILERERTQKLSAASFGQVNHQMERLNAQLQKKEAREQQLCAQLQLMIERRKEEEKESNEEKERKDTKKYERYPAFVPALAQMEEKSAQGSTDTGNLEEEGEDEKGEETVKK